MTESSSSSEPSSSEQEKKLPPETVKKNQKRLLMIFGVALAPVIIAIFMYMTGSMVPQGKTNKGTLMLPPVQFDELQVLNPQGQPLQYEGFKTWQIIVVGEDVCDQRCEDALYMARQTRIGMGREVKRISLMYLFANEQDAGVDVTTILPSELASQHPDLSLAVVNKNRLLDALKAHELGQQVLSDNYIILADPLGNMMMYYTRDNGHRDLFDDLKKLLKLSKIG